MSWLRSNPKTASPPRLSLEHLEDRTVPYALSGYSWANPNVSASFMPDGTWFDGYQSNLFALYDAAYPTATWQREFARALQAWANVSPLNFHFVPDDGTTNSTPGVVQGDNRFGDIRLGATAGTGVLGYTYYPGNSIKGGDIRLNGTTALYMGSNPDLYSVLLHEAGHSLGLAHSSAPGAVMYGVLTPGMALSADDIAGIQAIYGARRPDAYDAVAANDSLASASALSLSGGSAAVSADLKSRADVDYYRVTVPSGSDGTLSVAVDARNLSLLAPKVAVLDAAGNVVATGSGSYGTVATVTLTGLVAGQTYYVAADGATSDAFGMGAYRLNVQFGGVAAPAPSPGIVADALEVNDTVPAATNLGKRTNVNQTSLTLHTTTDLDYFAFTAGNKGTYTVSATATQGTGTLSVVVLDASQRVLASSQSASGTVSVNVNLSSGAQYYIKVSSPTGSLFAYGLTLAQTGGSGGGKGNKGGALLAADPTGYQHAHSSAGLLHGLSATDQPEAGPRDSSAEDAPGLVGWWDGADEPDGSAPDSGPDSAPGLTGEWPPTPDAAAGALAQEQGSMTGDTIGEAVRISDFADQDRDLPLAWWADMVPVD